MTRFQFLSFFVPSLLLFGLLFGSCFEVPRSALPILGNRDVVNGDTIYPSIPDFTFVDQDSQIVTNATFEGKAYISDFFFVHCPTICPKVKMQMLRVQEKFKEEPNLMLLSHSIDTKNDTVAALKKYAEKLNINAAKWLLVTGDEDKIYEIAEHYFSVARKDPSVPGGFDHSGRLILVDKNRHVRAFCDGTDPKSVDKFMDEVEGFLKDEY